MRESVSLSLSHPATRARHWLKLRIRSSQWIVHGIIGSLLHKNRL